MSKEKAMIMLSIALGCMVAGVLMAYLKSRGTEAGIGTGAFVFWMYVILDALITILRDDE